MADGGGHDGVSAVLAARCHARTVPVQRTGCHRLHALLSPAFRRLASSNLAAQFSEQIALAAAPLAAVLALGADAAQTGYLQTAQTLPFLLLSLPAGVLADRMQRRLLMSAAECARAVSLLCLLALLWSGQLTLPLLAALVSWAPSAPSPTTWPPPRWCPGWWRRPSWPAPTAGWSWRAAPLLGRSAAGGALVSALGASAAYALATALSLLAALLLAGLPADAPAATATRRHIGRELSDGAAFVLRHPLLRPVLVTAVFFNVAWFVLQAVYVVYAIRDLELDAAGVGLTLGIYGLGMLAGALLAPRLARRLSFGALIAAGPLCALLASGLMLLTLARPRPRWRRSPSSCSAPAPSSGPSPPPRCARRSRPTPCWAAYRP